MKGKSVERAILAGALALSLAASASAASQRAVPERAQARPASRQQATRQATAFQTVRTDSWLCLYVSPFFCSNLNPSLGSTSGNSASLTSAVPDRSRR